MHSKAPAIALLLATAVALGQEAAPAPQVPVFSERVEVRVLDLDVDVTDSKGQPVTDLKREDFAVKIGGRVMPIDYFAQVSDGTIHSPDLATASPDQVLAAYTKGGEAIVPRNFLIYIDLGFISPGIRNRSINALSDFVTRLGPERRHPHRALRPLAQGPPGLDDEQGVGDVGALADRAGASRHVEAPDRAPDRRR